MLPVTDSPILGGGPSRMTPRSRFYDKRDGVVRSILDFDGDADEELFLLYSLGRVGPE
jgi:hypothetical protein